MRNARGTTAVGLLVVEAGLAVLGVLVHHGLLAEYGDVSDSTLEAWLSGFTTGVGGLSLVVVGVVGLAAALVTRRRGLRVLAAAVPALMALGMLVVTPSALDQKLEQYDATPRCVFPEDESGPGARAARESQEAFESIEHVGLFGGGGASGVGGCDRTLTWVEDVDVIEHYRTALPAAGWEITHDRGDRLRAERAGMAFEVSVCDGGAVVWAGEATEPGAARCAGSESGSR